MLADACGCFLGVCVESLSDKKKKKNPSGPKTHSLGFSEHIRNGDSSVFHVDVWELLKGSQRLFRVKMFLSLFQRLLLD